MGQAIARRNKRGIGQLDERVWLAEKVGDIRLPGGDLSDGAWQVKKDIWAKVTPFDGTRIREQYDIKTQYMYKIETNYFEFEGAEGEFNEDWLIVKDTTGEAITIHSVIPLREWFWQVVGYRSGVAKKVGKIVPVEGVGAWAIGDTFIVS